MIEVMAVGDTVLLVPVVVLVMSNDEAASPTGVSLKLSRNLMIVAPEGEEVCAAQEVTEGPLLSKATVAVSGEACRALPAERQQHKSTKSRQDSRAPENLQTAAKENQARTLNMQAGCHVTLQVDSAGGRVDADHDVALGGAQVHRVCSTTTQGSRNDQPK